MLVGGGTTGIRPHNGVVLDASPLTPTPADSLPAWDGVGAPPLWLALDEVVDPQNFGAVLRSAHFLGIDGVVVCAKNSAPLSPAVSKASSGAMETETVYSAGAMHRFLARCADEGWDVLGAAAESDAVDVTDVAVERPTVLVMGNEGRGLRTNVRRACSKMVKVEGAPGGSQGGGGQPQRVRRHGHHAAHPPHRREAKGVNERERVKRERGVKATAAL